MSQDCWLFTCLGVCCDPEGVWCLLWRTAVPRGPAPRRRGRACAAPCCWHRFFQRFVAFPALAVGRARGPGGAGGGAGAAPRGSPGRPGSSRKAGTDKPVCPFPRFSGRQSAILQGWQPPAAAACPPPGSCRFLDFPLVFPCETVKALGVPWRSPEVLARGPCAPGRSSSFNEFLKTSVFGLVTI